MGAAGRDFHNFNVYFRGNPDYRVVAFTASQIPGISGRVYPPELAGPGYPEGIPILEEERLAELACGVDEVVFAYSDLSHVEVMHRASLVVAAGADFRLMGPNSTMLDSRRPVVSVCAVRTGAGKSPVTRRVCRLLSSWGLRVVVVRHPMPYGDLARQRCQRFASLEDLEREGCTIEEREEYEPHIQEGVTVYSGVDHRLILDAAEREADVIVWDGGNNDLPFYRPDLHIVVADPHRPGHENSYHPGEANVRMADLVLVNKVDTAKREDVEAVKENVRKLNPKARIVEAASRFSLENPEKVRGKSVVVVEDGPTLTHGGMKYGAGWLAARRWNCRIADPLSSAVGTIREAIEKYALKVVPALGYSPRQIQELEETLNRSTGEAVISATPINLARIIKIEKPICHVTYHLEEKGPELEDALKKAVQRFQ